MNDILFWLWAPGVALVAAGVALAANYRPHHREAEQPDLFSKPQRAMANSEGLGKSSRSRR